MNQTLPSRSSSSPCGPDPGVFSGNSLISPVFGLTRPITFANIPVHQIDPSGPGSGSCGRDPSDRRVPFTDGHFHVARKHDRLRPRLLWKILRKVVADLRPLRGRQRHHRADQLIPTLFGEAAGVGDQAERVAFRALRLDGLFAGTVG